MSTSTDPTALRRNVRAALVRAKLTPSKKTASRVKGLPLISRGFVVERYGEAEVIVTWTPGSNYRANPEDIVVSVARAQEALGGFTLVNEGERLRITGRA